MTQSDFLGGATTEGATTAAFNSVCYLYDSLLSRSERGQSAGPAQFVDMCSCREIRLAAGEELHGYSRQNGLSKIALLVDRNAALSAVLNSKTIPAETSNRSWVTIGTFRRTGKITCAWCWWPPAIRSISAPRRGPWRIRVREPARGRAVRRGVPRGAFRGGGRAAAAVGRRISPVAEAVADRSSNNMALSSVSTSSRIVTRDSQGGLDLTMQNALTAIGALNRRDLEGRTLTVREALPRTDRAREDHPGGGSSGRKRWWVEESAMKTDSQLQQDVINELKWEPTIHAPEIGVAVKDGVVCY